MNNIKVHEKICETQDVIDAVRDSINKAMIYLYEVEAVANSLEKECCCLGKAVTDGSGYTNALLADVAGDTENLLAKFNHVKTIIGNGDL